ncbi:MAG: hypothetical protein GY917_02115, partial [Planctomycetaceae bacterium]|nr:hypothetical protein [Planctomycetaceae bacterium]
FESGTQAAWIQNRYKLYTSGLPDRKKNDQTKNNKGTPTYELYDLKTDPIESRNLANTAPDLLKSLVSQLTAWRTSCQESLQNGP